MIASLNCCTVITVHFLVQVEEQRKNESERTGKVHEDMAQARTQLKRIDKEMKALQVQSHFPALGSNRMAHQHGAVAPILDEVALRHVDANMLCLPSHSCVC